MIDLLSCVRGKLDDPMLMDWALRRYEDAQSRDAVLAHQMEQAWFDDLILRRWIGSGDQDVLTLLFGRLPVERFINITMAIVERWPQWPASLASRSAPILTACDPGQAAILYMKHLDQGFDDADKTAAVIEQLPKLPEIDGRRLLASVTDKVLSLDDHSSLKKMLLPTLLHVTVRMHPESAILVFDPLIKTCDSKERLEGALKTLSDALFDNSDFFETALLTRQNQPSYSFTSWCSLFVDNASLDACARVLKSSRLLPEAMELLSQYRDRSSAAGLAFTLAQRAETVLDKSLHNDLGCFAVASVLHAWERKSLETSALSLAETVELLSLDIADHRHVQALTDHLRSFDLHEVAEAIQQQMIKVQDEYGGVQLARVAGQLGIIKLAPLLIDSLGKDRGDYLCEVARIALSKLGEVGQKAVLERWETLDSSQQIYGLSVIQDVGGPLAVEFALAQSEEMLKDDVERWCELAAAVPDTRLVERLEPELHRFHPLIDEAFYMLCRLTDTSHESLEAVSSRVMQEQKRQQALREAFESGDLYRETLRLQLRCPVCGDENPYEVQKILLSEETQRFPHVIVDEFACVSCGAWPEFEFTDKAKMALMGEMLRLLALNSSGLGGQSKSSPLKKFHVTYRWEERPAAEVIAELRAAVSANPDSQRDWVVLGRVNYRLGRPHRAKECWQRVFDKDPGIMEAGLGLAQVMADSGQPQAAFNMLVDLLAHQSNWRFLRPNELPPRFLGEEFAELYNHLHRSQGIKSRPLLHPNFIGDRSKVGRNDPCPCGSGQKYKRCCLNASP